MSSTVSLFYSSLIMEKGDSYGAIAQSCASFVVICHYDKATVVCDGYDKVHLSKTTLINDVDKILIQWSASIWIQCSWGNI